MQQRPVLYRCIKYMMLVVHCPLLYEESTPVVRQAANSFLAQRPSYQCK